MVGKNPVHAGCDKGLNLRRQIALFFGIGTRFEPGWQEVILRPKRPGMNLEADGVRVFSGLHADTLVIVDAKELLADICADAGVSAAPIPADLQRDPAWQVRLSRRFSETAEANYGDDAGDEAGDVGTAPVASVSW